MFDSKIMPKSVNSNDFNQYYVIILKLLKYWQRRGTINWGFYIWH